MDIFLVITTAVMENNIQDNFRIYLAHRNPDTEVHRKAPGTASSPRRSRILVIGGVLPPPQTFDLISEVMIRNTAGSPPKSYNYGFRVF